ncbi:MAG: hypothetical protein JWQ19_3779 [Subtercola sp.]|nr:hypothetical protein [Subtercola sp.]
MADSDNDNDNDPEAGLVWSIKRSFVDYVTRMHDGRGNVTGGAMPTSGGQIIFSPDPKPRDCPLDADEMLAFVGDVRFTGHAGLLFVRIANPRVTLRGQRAELDIAHPYKLESTERWPLVDFEVAPQIMAGRQALVAERVSLRPEAVELFNDVYPAGELFDPIIIALGEPRTRL